MAAAVVLAAAVRNAASKYAANEPWVPNSDQPVCLPQLSSVQPPRAPAAAVLPACAPAAAATILTALVPAPVPAAAAVLAGSLPGAE